MKHFSPRTQPRKPHASWISGPLLAAFTAAETTAHRLYSADNAWLERFGDDLLLSYKDAIARDDLLQILPVWAEEHGLTWRRIFGKFLPRQNEDRAAPVLLEGDAELPLRTVTEENGMKFGLDFAVGYSAGLFIDQRANRTLVREAGIKRMLNTFAYTCSFSVAAALAGAETVSIDLSKKSLDRGRENFALNGLDSESRHQFYADDVLDMLPRLARKGEKFDAIILDPPTFSRGNQGRKFQVESDLETLLAAALELASPRARILISTNCTRLTRRALESVARFVLKTARLGGDMHAELPLSDIPPAFAAQTLWVTLR